MRFWDSSAIVPLLIGEASSRTVMTAYRADPAMAVWWATPVECVSAIARAERDARLAARDVEGALENLDDLAGSWHEILPVEPIRREAVRILRLHALRAIDALQLAAARAVAASPAAAVEFVTLDLQLADAARREGLKVILPAS